MIVFPPVAFIGKAGAGKTTAANFLADGFDYTPLSFAAPLKQVAQIIWGEDALRDRDKLQKLGVAVRGIDPDAWCNLLVRQISQDRDLPRWVVDDCRFPNEYDALKSVGFVFVRIDAPRWSRIDRLRGNGKLQDEAQLEHESETALDGIVAEYTVFNDCPQGVFEDRVLGVLNKEIGRSS